MESETGGDWWCWEEFLWTRCEPSSSATAELDLTDGGEGKQNELACEKTQRKNQNER